MKKIAILGITGSIGTSACDVIREHSDEFEIVLASANRNLKKALNISQEFKIPQLVIIDESQKIDNKLFDSNTNIYYGQNELKNILQSLNCDIVLNAISGSAGLVYTIIVLERGIKLALANKESLIMAGHLIKEIQKRTKAELIPVDSEHSAILQAINETDLEQVKSLIITASGGPFRTLPLTDFRKISIKESLSHPTWEMGAKITIDSATMMNKGLEVIEAHWLFEKKYEDLKAVIHPQSIIHSFVEFIDGSIIAQLGFPSMKLPILYSFSHPQRFKSNISSTNILDLPNLSFEEIDKERYPLFFITVEAGKLGGLFPTIINAANEAAVSLFLNDQISFLQIYQLVNQVIQATENIANPDIETIIEINSQIYDNTKKEYRKILKIENLIFYI
ncbi:MAG: 1-deoxy-D-xylulose-5-phosphate reductoisomerase [Candidatus Cloacimonetes bacterium]|nr:1-deoxy-D-xylulose-5-phosphate reductoisomerase [Candidatus Cloacimonadota bacterium]